MNHSTPGLPVHHQLPVSTQTHGHWVGDTNQPSYPLSSPSPPALNLSQHQGLFKWTMILVFWMLSFKPEFSLSSFTFIKNLFSSSSLSAIRVVSYAYLGYYYWSGYFSWQSWFQLVLVPGQHFSWCTLIISQISRVTIYSLDVLLFLFGTGLLFHVQF